MVEDFDAHRSARVTEPTDVLVLGPPVPHRAAARRRRLALLALVLIMVLVGLAAGLWRHTVSPTLTVADVEAAYGSLPSADGPVAWDASTISVERSTAADPRSRRASAGPCDQIYSPRVPPVSAGRVSIELPRQGRSDGGRRWSGSAVTFTYRDAGEARDKFELINDFVRQCRDAAAGDTSITISNLTSDPERWSGSATRFSADLAWSRSRLGVNLVRYGNTVTWVVRGDDPEPADVAAVTDALMDELRAGR